MDSSVFRPRRRAVLAVAGVLGMATFSVLAQSKPQPPPAQKPAASAPAQRTTPREAEARPLRVLVVGGEQTPAHSVQTLMPPLVSALARRGIQLISAAMGVEALSAGTLPHYDALLIFGDPTLTPEQQKAVAAFVDGGKGVLGIHSPSLVAQVGAQSSTLQPLAAPVTAEIVAANHPILRDVQPFASVDEGPAPAPPAGAETTVLMQRTLGQAREAFTWVRTQGKGRMFYTGYGH